MKNIALLALLLMYCVAAQEYTPDSTILDKATKKSCTCLNKKDPRTAEAQQKINFLAYCKFQGVAVLELNRQLTKAVPATITADIKIDAESKSYKTNLKFLEKQLEEKCEKYNENLGAKDEKAYDALSKVPAALEYYQLGNEAYKQKKVYYCHRVV